uniref:sialic acid-binding Ig-like lectin 13 isoform X2 n=1 Tax=Pristiophorus japonicus TaxID=55135 RepID=UPI00398E3618
MEVLRLVPIFLCLLPGALSKEWSIRALSRRALSTSCVVIPCTFDFPSHPYTALHGAWFKYWYYWKYAVYYTKDPGYGMSTFVGRTKIVGDLEQKNCSLRINNLSPDDSDVYYFYVQLEGFGDHTFKEPVHLQVVQIPDRPEILLTEDITEGKPASIICKALYACPDNHPFLNWSALPDSTVGTITKSSDEVSTVLTFKPSFKHHGLTVHCTSKYPETAHQLVNSVTLSVKYFPRNTHISMTFIKGNIITLNCSSKGNPAIHRFSWSKVSHGRDTELRGVGQTITVPIGFGEEISYYCKATNTLGSSQSAPVTIPTQYGAIILSESKCTRYLDNVTCLCVVQSNSTVEVKWHWPGRSIKVTGSDGVYKTQCIRAGPLVTNTLTISGSNLTIEMINCSVANSQGRAPSWMQLEIQSEKVERMLEKIPTIPLAAAGGTMLLIVSMAVVCLIVKACRRNGKRKRRRPWKSNLTAASIQAKIMIFTKTGSLTRVLCMGMCDLSKNEKRALWEQHRGRESFRTPLYLPRNHRTSPAPQKKF